MSRACGCSNGGDDGSIVDGSGLTRLFGMSLASVMLVTDAMLWAAGVDLSAGGLSLMYDPDDVDRMRARKEELEKRLGVPVRITSGRVRDL